MFRSTTSSSRIAQLAAAAAFVFATFGSIGSAAAGDTSFGVRLFGTAERANPDTSAFPKWTAVLGRYSQEKGLETAPCAGANCALQNWAKFVTGLKGQARLQQLEAVNEYVNRTTFEPDSSRYGISDYWATPREFFGKSGDCEDFAIAKYLSLRKLGWSADELRIAVVMHHSRREIHAILIAYHNGTAYVLDNLLARPTDHGQISHYQPFYSINEHGWYHHSGWSPGARVAASPSNPGGLGNVVASRRTLSPAARSYAGNPDEGTASLFTPSMR